MLRIKAILTETGCIVTESQTLFPLSTFFVLNEILLHILFPFHKKEKSSNIAQKALIVHQGVIFVTATMFNYYVKL